MLISLAGHYGGHLTHGEDYLTKYMPTAMKTSNVDDDAHEYMVINAVADST